MVQKKKRNIQRAAALWLKMPCWHQRSEENGWIASMWQEDSNSNKHSLQPRYAEEHLQTGCYSCQPETGNWSYNSYRLIKDWKHIAWSDESQFLLQHSDGRVRTEQQESIKPTTQAGDIVGWGTFSWHIFCPILHQLCEAIVSTWTKISEGDEDYVYFIVRGSSNTLGHNFKVDLCRYLLITTNSLNIMYSYNSCTGFVYGHPP